jgi:hypothetical protein
MALFHWFGIVHQLKSLKFDVLNYLYKVSADLLSAVERGAAPPRKDGCNNLQRRMNNWLTTTA